MTEAQTELYKRTKDRLRRLGKENPADVIIALAEEIELYRKKIHALEEYIELLHQSEGIANNATTAGGNEQ